MPRPSVRPVKRDVKSALEEIRRELLEARELLEQSMSGRTKPFEVVALVDQNGSFSSETIGAMVLTSVPLLREFVPR